MKAKHLAPRSAVLFTQSRCCTKGKRLTVYLNKTVQRQESVEQTETNTLNCSK